ncbi:MAG: hypothetical protein GVY26_06750, partial [Bacteroidetes bacterium]|nr:hypothetical protein [Bacteroidota bacterium]
MLYRCLLALLCLNAALLPAQTAPELLRAARAEMGLDTNTALLKINRALELAAAGSATADSAHYALQAYYKAAPDHLHAYPEVSRAYEKLEAYYRNRQDTAQLTNLYLQWADLEQKVDLGESEKRVSQAIALAKANGDLKSLADSHFRMGVLQGSMRNDELVLQ